MQQNYYLLRNNQESGPYTIDELLLQQLKHTDLVWVEGRMNAWCHPWELDELTTTYQVKKNAGEPAPKSSKKISPAPPKENKIPKKEDIESRAEEIRKKILMQSSEIKRSKELHTKEEFSPTKYYLKEDSIDLVVRKKRMALPGAHLSAAALMLAFIGAAWFGKDIWLRNAQMADSEARVSGESIELVQQARQAKSISATPLAFPQQEAPAVVIEEFVTDSVSDALATTKPPAVQEKLPVSSLPAEKPEKLERTVKPEEDSAPVVEMKEEELPKEPEVKKKVDSQVKKPLVVEPKSNPVNDSAKNKSEEEPEADTEKKKSFGQVIKGIFKKKKKDNQEKDENQD